MTPFKVNENNVIYILQPTESLLDKRTGFPAE